MRRRVQIVHLGRTRILPLARRVKSSPVSQWPAHIKLAWEVLQNNSNITEKTARALIVDSILAAGVCAEAINRRSENTVEWQSRERLSGAFRRLAKCSRRAPAELRKRLDAAIGPMLRQNRVDLELIEDIFDAIGVEFQRYPSKTSATALRAMFVTVPGRKSSNWIKNEYGGVALGESAQL
jgi:hypothetical protein